MSATEEQLSLMRNHEAHFENIHSTDNRQDRPCEIYHMPTPRIKKIPVWAWALALTVTLGPISVSGNNCNLNCGTQVAYAHP